MNIQIKINEIYDKRKYDSTDSVACRGLRVVLENNFQT